MAAEVSSTEAREGCMPLAPAALPAAGFESLAALLRQVSPFTLMEAQSRLALISRDELIQRFRRAFVSGKRKSAYVFAAALTRIDVPPCFRHDWRSSTDYSAEQRADLVVFDLEWLRHRHRDHGTVVKYRRCLKVFKGTEGQFLYEAAYMANGGEREPWKVVKSLSLTEEQQLELFWLRSAPIKRRLAVIQEMRARVFDKLKRDLDRVRRTRTFTDAHATSTLLRRHRLWLAQAHTARGPVEAARRYEQLTGHAIDRKVAARQLAIVADVLKRSALRETEGG